MALGTDACEDADYINVRVQRLPEMDSHYRGKTEISISSRLTSAAAIQTTSGQTIPFGWSWIRSGPPAWIEAVFDACKAAPWHTYLFLTKNPKRYAELANAGKVTAPNRSAMLPTKMRWGFFIWAGSPRR